MKAMTTNLKYFSGLTLIFSITFFYYLYSAISIQSYDHILKYAIFYGSALFVSGLLFGYKDSIRNSRLDLGFQYHLKTYIIVNFVGILSMFIALGLNSDTLLNAFLYLICWSLGLIIHYYFSSRSIKGLGKKKLFD